MYATLAGVFREIISESKRYPSPLLLRKAKTRHRFGERGHTLPDEIPATSSVKSPDKKTAVDTSTEEIISATPIVSLDPNTPTDTTQLLEQIIAWTKNPMLKSALKQYVMVDELSEKMLSLIVINEQYYHSLSTHEYTGEIEQKLEETLGRQLELRRTHMTKEQRLAKQMQHQ